MPWQSRYKLVKATAPVWLLWGAGFAALLLAVVFAVETALAVYHAGVEWRWWPGPASCTGGGGRISLADMTHLLHGPAMHVVRCDEAAWRLLGLSMAGWNALCALALTLATLVAFRRMPQPR